MTNNDTTNLTDPSRIDEGQLEAFEIIDHAGIHRRNIIHAGVKLGIFEAITEVPISADEIAADLELDSEYAYRLLRALANYDVMDEHEDHQFSLTSVGKHFKADHPRSVRDILLATRSTETRLVWTHLPDIVEEGGPDGFVREFGCGCWEYMDRNPAFAEVFNGWMTVGSQMLMPSVLDALKNVDLDRFSTVCDVGGGHGYLLCHLLATHPHLEGSVLDLPSVVEETTQHWAPKLGVEDRCTYIAGDMFEDVPEADAYFEKFVLHDWSDPECVDVLSTIHEASSADARVFLVERLVPGPATSHPSKPSDVHMMVHYEGGRERTEQEFRTILDQADWKFVDARTAELGSMSVVEAKKA